MNTSFLRGLRRGLTLLALLVFAGNAFAGRLIYMGGHELDQGRLAAMGHSLVDSNPDDASWTALLNGSQGVFDAVIVGEGSNGVGLAPATVTAIRNYVTKGGRMIVVGDHEGSVFFMNSILGYNVSATYGCDYSGSVAASKLPAATGSFAVGPASLRNESCTSALNLSSIPADMRVVYGSGSNVLAGAKSAGAGRLTWLGWDYCCAGTQQSTDDWYIVLDNAIRFTGFFTTCSAEGFSGTKLTMCRQVCETPSLSTSARAGMVKMYTTLYGPPPSCPLLQPAVVLAP